MLKLWRRNDRLADWLPWLLPLNADGEVLLTRAGGLLRTAKLDLPDFETASPEELIVHHRQLADALARFGNGWSIWLDQWRLAAPGYLPECGFGGNLAAKLIDDSRRRQFTSQTRPVFQNHAFIAVHYLPQRRDALLAWLMDREDAATAVHVSFFHEHTDALFRQLGHVVRGVTVLRGDDLASYLEATVSYRPRRVEMPTGVLAPQLAAFDWQTSPSLSIEGRHLATVEVRNFGSPSPLTCEPLHALDFEARWCTTLHGLDPDARRHEINEVRKRWLVKRKPLKAILTEIVTRNPWAGDADPEADRAIAQLDVMQGDLAHRPFALGTVNVHVWGDTREQACERAGHVASILNAQGATAKPATLNDVFAVLADMPGNVTEETGNLRRLNVEIGAITRFAPVTGVDVGHREDWRFKGPALMAGTTRRGMPMFIPLNPPEGDGAHTAVVGKTGAGKSTLLALMAAQFLRYDGSRVIVFDRRRSFMVACLALGGDWIELGGGGKGAQPLRSIHRPEEFAWAQNWVIGALRRRGLAITPAVERGVTDAMGHVADLPPDERTLTRLHTYLSGHEGARQALGHYLDGHGPYGDLLDGVVPSYGTARVIGIETIDIVQLEEVAPLVVAAVFRAVQRDLITGRHPSLLMVDEAWSLLDDEHFGHWLESFSLELRKQMTALVLSTQSIHHFATRRGKIILDQMGNRFWLPHADALRPITREAYEAVGLSEDQIRVLAGAVPKGEYFLQTERISRLVTIRLEGEALRLCGASSAADRARAWALLDQGIAPGEPFVRAWLSETTDEWRRRVGWGEREAA